MGKLPEIGVIIILVAPIFLLIWSLQKWNYQIDHSSLNGNGILIVYFHVSHTEIFMMEAMF